MSQEKTKNPIDVEKAKEVAKSPKGKIGAVISVVVILAVVGTLAFLFNKTDSPDDYEYTSNRIDIPLSVTIVNRKAFDECPDLTIYGVKESAAKPSTVVRA